MLFIVQIFYGNDYIAINDSLTEQCKGTSVNDVQFLGKLVILPKSDIIYGWPLAMFNQTIIQCKIYST